ncbi:MAG TPA: bifunctional riboflavin kinase/FAD synthetase [Ktedonobacteraceae bacterium]|nr:bifunctional riboflavin kinase/FAD synthetase [Ktedonobacteraceae bacterium]
MEYNTTVSEHEPIAITIGNFDGVHRGHQRLMRELAATAQQVGAKPVMLTFTPHTLMVVKPDLDVRYITSLEEELALTRRYGGIADSIVLHFTREVAALSAETFLDNLRAHFQVKALLVGANFSLGHNRMGNTTFLEQYGEQHGIAVRVVPLTEADETRISSTRIRTLVSEGRVAEANELLGHPVVMSGVVRHGDGRGRLLGFPTANMIPDPHRLLLANGIYATYVHLHAIARDEEEDSPVYMGAANIGIRPMFESKERLVEVYILDIDQDLYDQHITVDFIARLRNEERFDSIEALKSQMALDVEKTRQVLQK